MPQSALALLLVLGACSAVVESDHDFSRSTCRSHRDCEVLNAADGIGPNACRRWQCGGESAADGGTDGARRCTLRLRDGDGDGRVAARCDPDGDCDDAEPSVFPGSAERCDGKDNDCDEIVDEANDGAPVIEPVELSTVSIAPRAERIAYARDAEGGAAAIWIASADDVPFAELARLHDPSSVREFKLRVPRSDTLYAAAPDTEWHEGTCRAWTPFVSPKVIELACEPLEIAFGFVGQDLLSGAVAQLGDADGQLRIGHAAIDDPGLAMRGPAARANSYLGIDIDTEGPAARGQTTGQSRTGGRFGASRPALDTLTYANAPQALVAWLADGPYRAECAAGAVGVEGVVAFLEQDERGLAWVSSTTQHGGLSNGAPRAIPHEFGLAAEGVGPAVLAWPGKGYFVAYGNADGGLTLHFVPAPAPPPPLATCLTDDDCVQPDVPRDMPPLAVSATVELPPLRGPVNGVALAGAVRAGGFFNLGIACREGCGDGQETIVFRRLVLREDEAGLSVAAEADPVWLSPEPGRWGPPALAYSETGFVRAAERSPSALQGGFMVAFSDYEAGRVLAGRIAARDTKGIDRAPIVIGTDLGGGGPLLARPFLYTDDRSAIRYAYTDGPRGVVHAGRVSCAAPD